MSRRYFLQESSDNTYYFPENAAIWAQNNVPEYATMEALPATIDGKDIVFDSAKNVTNMLYMFMGARSLKTIPPLNTSKVTTMQSMFSGCSNLINVPLLDTSKVTTMQGMFQGCTSLTNIPQFDFSKVKQASYMFAGCSNLTSVPIIDTSNITAMTSMFANCSSLPAVFPYAIDLQKISISYYITYLFDGASVTTVRFKNVPSSLASDLTPLKLGGQLTSITIENTI